MLNISLLTTLAENLWGTILVALCMWVYSRFAKWSQRLPRLSGGIAFFTLASKATLNLLTTFNAPEKWRLWAELAFIVFLGWLIFSVLFEIILTSLKRSRAHFEFPKITKDFIQLIAYILIAIVLMRMKGNINPASFITTSAVLTAVIGLALQNTLTNLFSGLVIQLDQPFTIGEWIRYEDITGQVVSITWKSTQILTREHGVLFIPNVEISNKRFVNLSRPSVLMQTRIPVALPVHVPPNQATGQLLNFLKQQDFVLGEPAPQVKLIKTDANNMNYELIFWHKHIEEEENYKDSLQRQLWYLLKRYKMQDVKNSPQASTDEKKGPLENILQEVPLMQVLGEKERQALLERVEVLHFGKDEVVVKQHEAGSSLYIIAQGSCEVLREQDGQTEQIAVLAHPQFFGEMSLLTGEPRSATVRCLEDSQLLRIRKAHLQDILQNNPQIANQLAELVAQRQAQLQKNAPPPEPRSISSKILKFFGLA